MPWSTHTLACSGYLVSRTCPTPALLSPFYPVAVLDSGLRLASLTACSDVGPLYFRAYEFSDNQRNKALSGSLKPRLSAGGESNQKPPLPIQYESCVGLSRKCWTQISRCRLFHFLGQKFCVVGQQRASCGLEICPRLRKTSPLRRLVSALI